MKIIISLLYLTNFDNMTWHQQRSLHCPDLFYLREQFICFCLRRLERLVLAHSCPNKIDLSRHQNQVADRSDGVSAVIIHSLWRNRPVGGLASYALRVRSGPQARSPCIGFSGFAAARRHDTWCTVSSNALTQSCRRAGGRIGTATPKTRCKGVLTYARAQMVLHRGSVFVAPTCSPTWCPSVAFRVLSNMWLPIPGSATQHVPNACCGQRAQCAVAREHQMRSVCSTVILLSYKVLGVLRHQVLL